LRPLTIHPPQPYPPKVRAEFLCSLLVAICVVVPEVEQRLKGTLPGQGRRGASDAVDGAARAFALSEALAEPAARELAWLSYALLKNVNCCGVVLVGRGGGALAARGAIGAGVVGAAPAATLEAVGKVRLFVGWWDRVGAGVLVLLDGVGEDAV
jgi:hypothetical protein